MPLFNSINFFLKFFRKKVNLIIHRRVLTACSREVNSYEYERYKMFDFLSEKFDSAFKHIRGKGKITENNIEVVLKEVRTSLLEADVNFKVVRSFIQSVKEKSLGEKVISGVNPEEQFVKIVQDELSSIMGEKNQEIDFNKEGVIPILIVGLNGQGKTTFSGKLSLYLKNKLKKDVLLVPADTYRPAAKNQLIVLANQIGVDYFDSDLSQSPCEIAKAGFQKAKELNKNIVIIDTAGRLHVDLELMSEIRDVKKALEFAKPEVLLVADAMTGQEAVEVAKGFNEAVGLTGTVLSKMDSDTKGGAALSICHITEVPIRYISMGEKMEDLELFHPDRLAGRILDMGDVVSLVEKAEETINEKEAENMMKKMEKGKFSVSDFMKQMEMMSKLGSMSSLLKMVPGMGGMLRQVGDLTPAENDFKNMRVIINSMTNQERDDYKIIESSRIERIAKGSGKTIRDIQNFLGKFKKMEQMMGTFSGMMKGGMLDGEMPDMNQLSSMMKKKKKKNKGKNRGPFGGGFFG